MNRAQRRAALKQHRGIQGFDITKGTLEISVEGSDEKLVVDTMDAGVMFAIQDMYKKFMNLRKTYAEDYDKAFSEGDDAIDAKMTLMRRIITDFSDCVESIFGEDSCKLIFGHRYPQVVQISEFLEDFKPIAAAVIQSAGFDTLDSAAEQAAASVLSPV